MRKTILYSKKLEAAGLTREQATAHLEILEEVVEDEMATKADIENLKLDLRGQMQAFKSDVAGQMRAFKAEIKAEMDSFKTEVGTQIQDLRTEMYSEFRQLELRMTVKFGLMQAATVGILAAVVKLL